MTQSQISIWIKNKFGMNQDGAIWILENIQNKQNLSQC